MTNQCEYGFFDRSTSYCSQNRLAKWADRTNSVHSPESPTITATSLRNLFLFVPSLYTHWAVLYDGLRWNHGNKFVLHGKWDWKWTEETLDCARYRIALRNPSDLQRTEKNLNWNIAEITPPVWQWALVCCFVARYRECKIIDEKELKSSGRGIFFSVCEYGSARRYQMCSHLSKHVREFLRCSRHRSFNKTEISKPLPHPPDSIPSAESTSAL